MEEGAGPHLGRGVHAGPRWSWLVAGGQHRDQQDCSKGARQRATGDGDREEKGGQTERDQAEELGI